MAEKPPKLLFIDHQNGNAEVPGFFIVQRNGDPVANKAGDPMPRRWNSLGEASAYVANASRTEMDVRVMERSPFGQPIVWMPVRKDGKGGDLYAILYIGSFRYHDTTLVDTLVLGTAAERGATTRH